MKHGGSYSERNQGNLTAYRQLKQRLSSTSDEQYFRELILRGQTLLCQPTLPSPADWGWQRQARGWSPDWTTLKQAKDTCYELIRCGCKTACRGRCKCMKANLVCTSLCKMWRKLLTAIVKEHSSDKVYICRVYIKPVARYVSLEFVQR